MATAWMVWNCVAYMTLAMPVKSAAQDERGHEDAARVQPGEPSGLGVAAHGVLGAAGAAVAHPQEGDDREDDHDPDRHAARRARSVHARSCSRPAGRRASLPPATRMRPPLRMLNMPRVTTMEGMRRYATKKPLMAPMSMPPRTGTIQAAMLTSGERQAGVRRGPGRRSPRASRGRRWRRRRRCRCCR